MWLHCLQRLELPAETASDQTLALDRIRDELSAALPGDAATVTRLLASCEAAFERCEPAVPSHGDFHPMNIFVGEDDSVTAIDVDTFAHRHASFDVAYFAAQTAIMGHHVFESFEATRALRERFLEAAPRADAECLHLWTAFALLRSLHYDLCILKLENKAQVAPFLRAAEFGLDA
jgi:Ser/Thr protein kinase RdoA (MazF antagonist)